MSPANSILIYLLVLVALFVIVSVVMFTGLAKNRSRTNPGERKDAGGAIHTEHAEVAQRLGSGNAVKANVDPRGEDVGGNFSTGSATELTGDKEQR